LKGFTVEYIERNKNNEADDLAKATARNRPMPGDLFFHVIEETSVKTVVSEPRLINIIEVKDWRTPIMVYLHHYYEPDSINEETRMQQQAKAYQIVDNNLYKASVLGPLLRCLSKAEGQELLSEACDICQGFVEVTSVPEWYLPKSSSKVSIGQQ
jgi:hypothetical protein